MTIFRLKLKGDMDPIRRIYAWDSLRKEIEAKKAYALELKKRELANAEALAGSELALDRLQAKIEEDLK